MPYAHYLNLKLNLWFHRERLGKTRDCLCISRDSTDHGRELLGALLDLKGSANGAKRTLTFAPTGRSRAINQLLLALTPQLDELKVMKIERHSETATITMTSEGVALLIEAVESWLRGAEDFGVSPTHSTAVTQEELGQLDRESIELWFWGPHMMPAPA